MNISYYSNDMTTKPFLKTMNDRVSEVGHLFCELTGYSNKEILDKPVSIVFQQFLRINSIRDDICENTEPVSCFLFSKSLEVTEVRIQVKQGLNLHEKVYIFDEMHKSRLAHKFLFLKKFLNDNSVGVAIYSVPDFTLLKVNNLYIGQLLNTSHSSSTFIDQSQVQVGNMEYTRYLGQNIRDLMPTFQGGSIEKTWNNIVLTNKTLYRTECKGLFGPLDEKYWDSTIMPIDENGEVKFIISILEDVTERVNNKFKNEEYQKTIEKQAHQLQIITKNMSDALCIINRDESCDYHNQRLNDLYYKAEEYEKYSDSFQHTNYYYESGKKLGRKELPGLRLLNGEKIENVVLKVESPVKMSYHSFNGSPIYNEMGEISSAILCIRDVTEKYIYEQEIRQKREQLLEVQMNAEMKRLDGLNLIGQIAASIAHEIRNPMSAVRGFLQLLGAKPKLLEYQNYFQLMIEELDSANLIITEFLSLGRNNPMVLKVKNLNTIIRKLHPMIQADALENDLNVVVELQDIPNFELDEQEIRQLILNITRNGLEAMVAGGIFTIKTHQERGNVVISFTDQGTGIPPEILENIGKPFVTTKESGTGLGLAVTYNIVHRHGGTINIETGAKGTTFVIRFPIKLYGYV